MSTTTKSLLRKIPKYSFQFSRPSPSQGHFSKLLLHAVRQYLTAEQRLNAETLVQNKTTNLDANLLQNQNAPDQQHIENDESQQHDALYNYTVSSGTKFFYSDAQCLVLYDAFPKSRYHLLIVPRDLSILSTKHLSKGSIPLLRHMLQLGEDIVRSIQKQDEKHAPSFQMGFHAIPSLELLHMHVISKDFVSPCLKNKKHWNSFTTEFFVDAKQVIQILETEGKVHFDAKQYKAMEKRDLECDGISFKTMPKLKLYLQERSVEGEH